MATEVNFLKWPFTIKTYGKEYYAKSVIISTGASPNLLNIPGEKELTGKGVSYCGTCDGWFFKDKKVVVVGGGDSALEEGLFLTRFASTVTIIHRRDQLRAGKILQSRASKNTKISYIWNSVLLEIQGDKAVQSVLIENVETGERSTFDTDGVFIFIGHTPNSDMFEGQLKMDVQGFVEVDEKMHTNIPGVFAAGEIMDFTLNRLLHQLEWVLRRQLKQPVFWKKKNNFSDNKKSGVLFIS